MVKNKKSIQNKQSETAQVAQFHGVMDHPSNKITPAKMRALFEEAEQGRIQSQHELFADIEERDSAIAAALQTRKLAVLGLNWHIAPPAMPSAQEEQISQFIRDWFENFPALDDLLLDMMDAVGHGFSALEIQWDLKSQFYLPTTLVHRPQSWFCRDGEQQLLLRTPNHPEGEQLWDFGWLIHEHKTRSSGMARSGLFRTLAWLYMFKHYSIFDFAEFLELYGLPIRIGKYPAGASKAEKQTLLKALAQIGHNAAGIMPEGMMIELHEAARGTTTTSNPFMQMTEWCEKSAARLILGQTLTSGADGKASTNALGQVHDKVRHDLLAADAKNLMKTINQVLIHQMVLLNFPNGNTVRLPKFRMDTRTASDFKEMADSLPKLVDIGVDIPESWVRDKLMIPDVVEGEKVLSRRVVADNPVNAAALAVLNTQVSQTTQSPIHEQNVLDGILDEALAVPDFNAQLNPVLKQAVAAVMNCDSYEEADAALTALYPNLDNQTLQNYLQNALFLSDLLGQANAKH